MHHADDFGCHHLEWCLLKKFGEALEISLEGETVKANKGIEEASNVLPLFSQ